MIHLEAVNKENIDELLALGIRDDQRGYVSTVAESLAQAYAYRKTAYPFAVYEDDTVVGFIMMAYYEAKQYYTLWKFLIDKAHQHKGIGKKALELGIAFLKDRFHVSEVYTGVVPENAVAKRVYASAGFLPTGLCEYGMEEWRLVCEASEDTDLSGYVKRESGTNVYYDDGTLRIRCMVHEDAKIWYDTYMSYDWHPQMEIYEDYFRDQEEGKRLVFVPEYEGKVAGICTLLLAPKEGPFAGKGWPEINDFTVFFHLHKKGIGNKLLDVVEAEAAKISDHVYLAVGVHSGYGPAQRIYVKRGYIPDGSGVWYQGKQLDQYAPCVNDDDLLLFLSKEIREGTEK